MGGWVMFWKGKPDPGVEVEAKIPNPADRPPLADPLREAWEAGYEGRVAWEWGFSKDTAAMKVGDHIYPLTEEMREWAKVGEEAASEGRVAMRYEWRRAAQAYADRRMTDGAVSGQTGA